VNQLKRHAWVRDPRNPIFVPQASFDKKGTQSPCVVPHDGRWWMFYTGLGTDGVQRICLATASADKPTEWERLGQVLEPGGKDAFDERGATYPRVHRVGNQWHLYYSGHSTRTGPQIYSAYWGIGLAQSADLRNWTKYSDQPVLQADGIEEYPESKALVGLGNIIEFSQPDGRVLYRLYYTLLPGFLSDEPSSIKEKVAGVAHSFDGVNWTDRRTVLKRRRNVDTEDIGIVGMQVWKTGTQYRATYAGLGTKYKSYAKAHATYVLAEAVSADGLTWDRGDSQDNVSLIPQPGTWESEIIGYAYVLREEDSLRVFYNGTAFGATGIGMAVAKMID
jgi:predicted GH43/DUF377 family glycosyl hydrolase